MKRLVKETLFGGASNAQTGRSFQTDTMSSTLPATTFQQQSTVYEKTFVEQPQTTTTTFVDTSSQAALSTKVYSAPVSIEKRERAAVIQEVVKPGTREEIQPVVHREREQLEIKKLLLPVYEKDVRPTIVEERQLAAEYRPETRVGSMPAFAEGPRSSSITEASPVQTIVKPPIVQETIRKKIIEEIQPVIYRQVIAPKLIKEVKPIYEKVVEAPVVSYATLPARYTGGAEYQTYVTTTTTTATPVEGLAQGFREELNIRDADVRETVTNVHSMSAAAPEFVPTTSSTVQQIPVQTVQTAQEPLMEETITTTTTTITEPIQSSNIPAPVLSQ